jgi:uncharacterized membrane protein
MATLTVWKFSDPSGAQVALDEVRTLEKEGLIDVVDGAVVTWPSGAKKPKTHQMHSSSTKGALGGSFWGFLFGLIFFVPLLGLAVGAAAGGLTGALRDAGIDDDFINEVRKQVTPGTSALFLLSAKAVMDKVRAALGGFSGDLISSNLSAEQDRALRDAFSEPTDVHS